MYIINHFEFIKSLEWQRMFLTFNSLLHLFDSNHASLSCIYNIACLYSGVNINFHCIVQFKLRISVPSRLLDFGFGGNEFHCICSDQICKYLYASLNLVVIFRRKGHYGIKFSKISLFTRQLLYCMISAILR